VIKIAHPVTCFYCKKKFDRDKIPTYQLSQRRYAHLSCYQEAQKREKKEQADKEKLLKYLQDKFGDISTNMKIKKQLKTFIEVNKYTYSGIHRALCYFYDIKKNPINKANNGIGIVPYVYREAYNYYYNIWLAQQKNQNKTIKEFIPSTQEVHIPIPKKKIKKRKLFNFLDKGG